MTRGKYSTRAQATAARTDAQTEAEAGRAAIVRLAKQVRDLTAELDRERAAHADTSRRLGAYIDAGTSPLVEALRIKLRDAEQQAARDTRAAKLVLARLLFGQQNQNTFRATGPGWAQIMDALGMTPPEFLEPLSDSPDPDPNRHKRRARTRKMNLMGPDNRDHHPTQQDLMDEDGEILTAAPSPRGR